jgi:hypothetical protein
MLQACLIGRALLFAEQWRFWRAMGRDFPPSDPILAAGTAYSAERQEGTMYGYLYLLAPYWRELWPSIRSADRPGTHIPLAPSRRSALPIEGTVLVGCAGDGSWIPTAWDQPR